MTSELKDINPGPSQQDMRRFDGSTWRKFEFRNGSRAILTSRGLELLRFNRGLRGLIRSYRDDAKETPGGHPPYSDNLRVRFRPGGNSYVYRLGGTEVLIKEGMRKNRPPQLWDSLSRMDYLYGICLRNFDPYVRVPDHYGLFTPANSDTEYLMMRKINNGVTVKDVARGRVATDEDTKAAVERDFSALKPKLLTAIREAQEKWRIPYRNLLPDWSDENVLADFTTRAGNKPYTLWIIDQ